MSGEVDSRALVPTDSQREVEVEKLKLQLVAAQTSQKNDSSGNKKRKRTVLDEDEYTEKMGEIIERDFFPDVSKMRVELQYQEAVEKNDFEAIERLTRQKLLQNMGESSRKKVEVSTRETPSRFETPLETNRSPESQQEKTAPPSTSDNVAEETPKSKEEKVVSLNSFLSKFTSEDNESFEQLQEEARRRFKERLDAISQDSKAHNQMVESALALPSAQQQLAIKASGEEDRKANRLMSWKHNNHNTVMYSPEGVPLTKEEADKAKSRLVILHENTRFRDNPFDSFAKPAPVTSKVANPLKLGKIGVDGKEMTAGETPTVNGFKFVASTPRLDPDQVPDSPLMTWGEIAATPMNIRGDATPIAPSTSFRIPEVPTRELVGQELASRILSKSKKTLKSGTAQSSTNQDGSQKSSVERLNAMSPAARLLATKKLGVHQGIDQSLQASYSPRLASSWSCIRTPTPANRHQVTPSPLVRLTPKSSVKQSTSSVSSTSSASIGRAKAQEFF